MSVVSPSQLLSTVGELEPCAERGRLAMRCVQCGTGRHLQRVALPYVFRHLVTELAAMNIKCTLDVR